MRWSLQTCIYAALLLIVPHSLALHDSDVGVVDWHKFFIGVPLVAAHVTAPSFHALNSVADANGDTTMGAEIIYTATANNVFAALNPKDGSVVWRYIYEKDDRIAGYYQHLNFVATLSGPGGATFRLFDGITGTLHTEKRLHAPEIGRPAEPHHLGTHVAFGSNDDVYVLANGHVVRHIDISSGSVQWTWTSSSATIIHTNLVSTPTAVFVVAFARSAKKLALHVTALDPRTGEVLHSRDVPSSIQHLHTYAVLSSSASVDNFPHVIWIENGLLNTFKLTADLDKTSGAVIFKRKTQSMVAYERILDVGLALSGNAVAVASDGSATLLGLVDGNVEGIGAIAPPVNPNPKKDEEEEITDSTWIGGPGENDGEVVVGRVYWSHKLNKIKTDTLTFTPVKDAFPELSSATLEFAFDTSSHGIIAHAALSRSSSRTAISLLLTTSTGAVQSWELASKSTEKWTREEALAAIVLSEFVQLPEGQLEGAVGSRGDGENYPARLWRHAGDAKNFPQYLSGFVRRFLTGSYASTTSAPLTSAEETPSRDAFGFCQIIIAATVQGKIFGLDSSTGRVVWSRVLGLGWAAEVGASVVPIKMFVLGVDDAISDQKIKGPEVVIVAQRRADNTLVDTVIFHIDALTGAAAPSAIMSNADIPQEDLNGLLQGFDIVPGPVVEAYLLSPPISSSASHKEYATSILLLDEFLQIYLYPSTPQTRATLQKLRPSLHFPLRTNADGGTRVMGHSIGPHHAGEQSAEAHDGERGFVAHATWTLGLPPDEVVKTMIPQTQGPVASLGKVLGNRTTLYKYLNPRLFVLLTAPAPATAAANRGRNCGLYVVDGVKGSVVYQASLPALSIENAGKEACDVKAMLVENWLVYHYYDPEWADAGLSKGWKVVSVELYEGTGLDEKTSSSDMSSFADDSVNIIAYEQAFLVSHAITALSPTSTKFGMSVKDLIVASRAHQIGSIQRHLLNPRRPHGKVTAQEQEEFLVSYEPLLLSDPRRVLSHNYEVANIQRIVTSPTLLESTSLVFAYGLDMFLTRVAPSNTFDVLSENFNKAQLVLTVTGLALAIIFTKPMVQRKRLREKWYQ